MSPSDEVPDLFSLLNGYWPMRPMTKEQWLEIQELLKKGRRGGAMNRYVFICREAYDTFIMGGIPVPVESAFSKEELTSQLKAFYDQEMAGPDGAARMKFRLADTKILFTIYDLIKSHYDYSFCPPEIYSVDDWFERSGSKNRQILNLEKVSQ